MYHHQTFRTRSPHRAFLSRFKITRRLRYVVAVAVGLFVVATMFGDTFASPRIQHRATSRGRKGAQVDRQKAVRGEFLHAWYGYRDHAWMADSLMSLTGGGKDQFCGWAATLVDSLDTLWIMDLRDQFDDAVNATLALDFHASASTCEINLFESTIRYLGGLLAAYDLSGDRRLLVKLVELGDVLYGQFHTDNGMPCSSCSLIPKGGKGFVLDPRNQVPVADVGTLSLEFTRLAQITGDQKYSELVTFLTDVFESTQNSSSIPGLWPEMVMPASIDGENATFATESFSYSLGASSDSVYEYLPKAHLLLGGTTDRYADMWHKAAAAIRENLLFRAYIPEWNTTDMMFSGIATRFPSNEFVYFEPRTQHLACFAGGLFAMSSRMFDNPDDLEIGKQLTEGCIWAYNAAPLGIMPETVTLLNCPNMTASQCEWNYDVWHEARLLTPACAWGSCTVHDPYPHGFVNSIDTTYHLRPEAIESVFILYRITGDEYYRDAGWTMFQNIIKHTRTPYGHAELENVMTASGTQQLTHLTDGQMVITESPAQIDLMESFWLAETLKYFYLLFDEPNKLSLDDWVLNTEAHPLRLTKGSRGV